MPEMYRRREFVLLCSFVYTHTPAFNAVIVMIYRDVMRETFQPGQKMLPPRATSLMITTFAGQRIDKFMQWAGLELCYFVVAVHTTTPRRDMI